GEEVFSEGNILENNNVPTYFFNTKEGSGVRRSSRQSKLPGKLNDYVLNSKDGLDKFVNHTRLFAENCRFIANINKSFEHKTYEEAALDKNWIQAMNDEMQALHENNTWILTDLLKIGKLLGLKCSGKFVALLVYVDDIVVTGNDVKEIDVVKVFLSSKFKIKYLGELKYFLGIEVLKTKKGGMCLSQRKYCLEFLHDFGLLACKPVSTPLPENIVLAHKESDDDRFLKNVTSYQRLVGKFIYLTITRPDIAYYVHCLSLYMHAPLQSHMSHGKVKKQASLSESSAEAEYRSMATTTCEVMWIVNILKDLKVTNLLPAELYCDNSAAIQITTNLVMREKTKHFDLDVHIIKEKVASDNVCFYRGQSGNMGYIFPP
ncbi:ribonuclease H-like domain-containing protein, partial [Tanacetum coccineum]